MPGVTGDLEKYLAEIQEANKREHERLEREAAKYQPEIFYFCGKIAKNDWRHTLINLSIRSTEYPLEQYRTGPLPIIPHAFGPALHYAGPFFVSCDHGCYHGPNSHGTAANRHAVTEWGNCLDCRLPHRDEVMRNCCLSIRACSIVFAWLDDLSAYGSFAEIGLAYAEGKIIWLAWPKPLPDLWFLQTMATTTLIAENPKLAFRELLFTQLDRSFL
jgi:hypothetical protein